MRDVQVVAEQHLQRMFAGFQRNFGHSAAVAEMNMILIFGDWQSEIRKARIDQEVVVPGVRNILTCRSDGHSVDAEYDVDGAADGLTIGRADEKYGGLNG